MADGILNTISSPADLKGLTDAQLEQLACEIRARIIEVTSRNGGHVASSLGAVEIILAVHSLIDAPTDKFVFDVGHQAYAHKIITGRNEAFETLRQFGGISGFIRPGESPYDVNSTGHASDSLSIALGLAKARDVRGTHEKIVALIGDASISGGMAFEALNMIGQLQLPIVIVLNDNEMAISRNVGAFMRHLGQLRTSADYRRARDTTQQYLEESGALGEAVVSLGRNMKDSMKHFVVPHSMMFEQLGIVCTPPVNGHSIPDLKDMLRTALDADGPTLVHVVTKKGAGYGPAEKDPERFHGVGPYDIATGQSKKSPDAESKPKTFTEVFSDAIVNEARYDKRVMAITAAMKGGTGLTEFAREFPNRFIDVGISEENAVGMAAGLAHGGMKPVVAIYSTFLQRAVDQIIVDASLDGCDVLFAIDRAGIVGADGTTHNGLYDIPYMRMIPGMRIIAPSDEAELVDALHTALQIGGPFAVRYPRGAALGVPEPAKPQVLPYGKGSLRRKGDDIALLSFGNMLKPALEASNLLAADGVSARVVDMRWVKPLDEEAIKAAAQTKLVVTLEDGIIAGGAGEAVLSVMAKNGWVAPALLLGINDRVVPHGDPDLLMQKLGLDAAGIRASILEKMGEQSAE